MVTDRQKRQVFSMDKIERSQIRADATALAMALVLILAMFLTAATRFFDRCEQVRGDTLRLHIVANSDTAQDQQNKLLVRDALLSEYSEMLGAAESEEAAERFASFLLDDIGRTAEKTLRTAGDEHAVQVSLARMYFDTRTYDDGITLPAGEYTALRVVIGDGGGHNWWCVMYPPLCIPAATAKEASEVEQRIESLSASPGYETRFALVEWAEKLRERFATQPAGAIFVDSGQV